jgi:DNA excision repair protein ERCC-3
MKRNSDSENTNILRLNKSILTAGIDNESDSDNFDYQDLSKELVLKNDHEKRPIWIAKNNIIILEAFSKYYNQAYDFLIDIAEPISRPTYFQTYQLTEDSLYSAVAVSRSTESIIKYLNILCKTNIPQDVEDFIRDSTSTFGKV